MFNRSRFLLTVKKHPGPHLNKRGRQGGPVSKEGNYLTKEVISKLSRRKKTVKTVRQKIVTVTFYMFLPNTISL